LIRLFACCGGMWSKGELVWVSAYSGSKLPPIPDESNKSAIVKKTKIEREPSK
jgi:hypothetical protein